jgi:ABC-type nitrate/sulfonate/bicarbonate transport system substrate-binding protein
VTKLTIGGRYRVLLDFDDELKRIFGTPPLKTGMAVLKDTAEKNPGLVKAVRGAYVDGIKLIKSGKDEDFFKARAKEFFNLSTPEEVAAGIKANRENFAEVWNDPFFQSQNKILQTGVSMGLLPKVGNLNDLWLK